MFGMHAAAAARYVLLPTAAVDIAQVALAAVGIVIGTDIEP